MRHSREPGKSHTPRIGSMVFPWRPQGPAYWLLDCLTYEVRDKALCPSALLEERPAEDKDVAACIYRNTN